LQFFYQIQTSFSLTDEQVDQLVAAGRALLRKNPDFQRFKGGWGVSGQQAGSASYVVQRTLMFFSRIPLALRQANPILAPIDRVAGG